VINVKIVTVVGARPQFIKASTVSRAIAEYNMGCDGRRIEEVIIHTGQHYDSNMSDIFFEEMNIPLPNYTLNIGGGSHGAMTGRQLESIEKVLLDESPDCVVVYGDTNSTLAGALAATKLHIPVAHIEAGLRSYNRKMPEEVNRVLTDHISSIHFTTSDVANQNLLAEGISKSCLHMVGDVMFDAALYYSELCKKPDLAILDNVGPKGFLLGTIHRAENTDSIERMKSIFYGLSQLDRLIILPLHPRTAKKLSEFGIEIADNIYIADPLGYLEMVWLEKNAKVILTDSGGVQKEAYYHQTPCITIRDETEWVELVDAGYNVLVPAEAIEICLAVEKMLKISGFTVNALYGDGKSAKKIVKYLREFFFEGSNE
jgi:UDP-GlcNAc3NAcA epimerase